MKFYAFSNLSFSHGAGEGAERLMAEASRCLYRIGAPLRTGYHVDGDAGTVQTAEASERAWAVALDAWLRTFDESGPRSH